ncbi:MAG: glycosyltransferase [Ectothiorhodospiraceae bacterium]|jgi:glycosyltransferase involved in cell wall biosynthesis|nr:glycosyltransferase [Ectothiorhodospiraceae bacterium]
MPFTLHIVGSKSLGGAERFALRLVSALAERGAPLALVARQGSEVVGQTPAGVPLHESPMKTVWDPLSKLALSRLLKRLRPDLAQTYMGRATRLTRLPSGRRPVHVARLGGYYKLDGYRHAHAWIGNTKGLCDYMVQGGLPAERVFHIYNFIDPPPAVTPATVTAARRELGIPDDALLLMTAGRFVEVKGQCHLLDAFARLPREIGGRPLWLVMVGDGLLRPALEAQAATLGIAPRIAWTGWRTDPAPYFEMADLVVFPSLENETLGNVILEAWVHDKPLVTAAFRGAREIVHADEDALMVPCADAPALADAIRHALADPPAAQAMAACGRTRVLREFSRDAIVDQYLALYGRLLGV